MYTIGQVKSLSEEELYEIKNTVPFSLPSDSLQFIAYYGYGEINNLLMFSSPDELYFRNNFAAYLDLWDWEVETDKDKALNGLTISTTIDGDIILCVDSCERPYMMIPRHTQQPQFFQDFDTLIAYYQERYKFDQLYYSPYYNRKMEIINLTKDGTKDEALNKKIITSLLAKFEPDLSLNTELQPKYIFQKIGGWVYFNMWSTLHVSYQTMYEEEANEIITFIKQQI